jgi:hypothetical protein
VRNSAFTVGSSSRDLGTISRTREDIHFLGVRNMASFARRNHADAHSGTIRIDYELPI